MKIRTTSILWISVLYLFVLSISSVVVSAEGMKARKQSDPMNTEEKIQIFKQSLQKDHKYYVKENPVLFQKLLIGNWYGPPHSKYFFKENGEFEVETDEPADKNKTGKWLIKDNRISIKFNNEKSWNHYEIEYFNIETNQDEQYQYTFYIKFKKTFYKAVALIINFN